MSIVGLDLADKVLRKFALKKERVESMGADRQTQGVVSK